jgi:hypothetical protein
LVIRIGSWPRQPVRSRQACCASGNYTGSLILFGSLAALAAVIALVARHPRPAT